MKNVTILGAGTLGQQIGFQCAFHGFQVVMYDLKEESLEACKKNHKRFGELFVAKRGATPQQVQEATSRIRYTTDLADAVKDADITSESVPEIVAVKKQLYQELGKLAPAKTIFTTNSSSLLPSQFAADTGRPERFLALHFANPVWVANIGEVMGHPGTDPAIYQRVVQFASDIGMVPITLEKEQNGYVINSLLIPLLTAAQNLVTNDVTHFENVDKTWMISTGMPMGPFGLIDMIGLETLYNVTAHWAEELNDPQMKKNADFVKQHFLDKGMLGVKTGAGYYTYPHPKFKEPDFLSPGNSE